MGRKPPGRAFCSLVAAFSCLAVLAACGGGDSGFGSKPPDYGKALAGAPRPLAKLYSQPGKLLSGGPAAFRQRIAELRGYPVVVNQWASWCGPCRAEFPWLQRLSATYGKRVAFLGVDSQDSNAAARTFLGEFPVPYPSYTDPKQEIGKLLKAALGLPDTSFYDSKGRLVYTRQGAYASQSDMAADIRRYALGG
jgi:cytochrome c biogenesis protein CcmG/thiol:disulfide interchange protein DsbE